ncbi:hypothetical protein JMJ77_0001567 [Colletotrichum scovillei]|uniref:Uncharacterized protein n=1 Tax=Colletotrichum scovillei TaxID=1209932 RepID=A0A9P7R670_9PEZI|nr:hypothetical protein JMJ77_0001567 [Colletotrichum scovillei]KAG7069976.1 hypothetical protein JMJ76_0001235 [Colletotrichum scovillei]KAG7078226.1 hypothetical protein JMJ78_0001900 [Colletotrichum scovillei]
MSPFLRLREVTCFPAIGHNLNHQAPATCKKAQGRSGKNTIHSAQAPSIDDKYLSRDPIRPLSRFDVLVFARLFLSWLLARFTI